MSPSRLNAILFWLYMRSIDNRIDPNFEFWKFRFGQIVQIISMIPECSRSEVDVELVWKVYFHVSGTTFVSPLLRGMWLSLSGLTQLAGRPHVIRPATFAFTGCQSNAHVVSSYGNAENFKIAVVRALSHLANMVLTRWRRDR